MPPLLFNRKQKHFFLYSFMDFFSFNECKIDNCMKVNIPCFTYMCIEHVCTLAFRTSRHLVTHVFKILTCFIRIYPARRALVGFL